jgi:hypothetical protein
MGGRPVGRESSLVEYEITLAPGEGRRGGQRFTGRI